MRRDIALSIALIAGIAAASLTVIQYLFFSEPVAVPNRYPSILFLLLTGANLLYVFGFVTLGKKYSAVKISWSALILIAASVAGLVFLYVPSISSDSAIILSVDLVSTIGAIGLLWGVFELRSILGLPAILYVGVLALEISGLIWAVNVPLAVSLEAAEYLLGSVLFFQAARK